MKIVLFFVFLSAFISAQAQYVGPARNTGREYGNSKMPLMVSHLAGANKERLRRVNKNSRHSVFGKIVCFRKLCRIQSGHSAPLRAISFKKFKKKVARNAKKGAYKKSHTDSVPKRPAVREAIPLPVDTVPAPPVDITPLAKADSLIVLGAELLFETNQSTLRSEHFVTLQSIVSYLHQHAERSVSISGHTDNTGVEARNLNLSRQRADVVAEYLVSNGIDIRRVETSGQGSARPIAENKTNEGRKKNRRVELLIHDR